jgi:hypothetical protein
MSRERFAAHANQHASKQANVSEDTIGKFLAGNHVSYHVKNAIQAALDELADYIEPAP